MSDTKIKLLEGNITSFKRQLASASDKDQVRRSIKACEDKLRQLRAGS